MPPVPSSEIYTTDLKHTAIYIEWIAKTEHIFTMQLNKILCTVLADLYDEGLHQYGIFMHTFCVPESDLKPL